MDERGCWSPTLARWRCSALPAPKAVFTLGVDAPDFYGTWKLFDGLTDAAFFGKNREHALGNTPQQRFMGVWSDGVAVAPLRVLQIP